MGIRLYPILKEGVTLNRVIGVTDSDYQLYLQLNALYESGAIDSDKYYGLLYTASFEGVNEVNGFTLFGWGKFACLDCMKDDDGYVKDCGTLHDMAKVSTLFNMNGIDCDLSLIDGVYWG
jgi:hypothetical protein